MGFVDDLWTALLSGDAAETAVAHYRLVDDDVASRIAATTLDPEDLTSPGDSSAEVDPVAN